MKHPYFKSLKIRLIACFILLSAAFIIHSCKKDNSNKEQAATNSNIVSLAKQWYNVTYPTAGKFISDAATQGKGAAIQDWSKTFSPYWTKANTFVIDSLTYIELPALKKGNMAMSLKPEIEPSQFNFNTSGSLTSLIIVSKNGAFYIYAMTILADSSYLKGDYSKVSNNTYRYKDKDFSGMIFYNRMDGSFVNGWQYKNGEITGVVTQTAVTGNPAATGTLGVTNPRVHVRVAESCSTTLTTTYWEDCSYYENDTYDQNPFNCYDYTTQGLSTSCTPTSTSSGGGSSNTTPPCNPPSSGAAVEGFRQISDVAAPPSSGSGGIVDQTNQIGTSQCLPATVTPPPVDTPKTIDPCTQKNTISAIAANAIIAAQNLTILNNTTSTGIEYGTNQNLTSLTSNTYINTPVTPGTTDSWSPTFTWNNTNGYTVGFSHGHPGGTGPSPNDVFSLVYNLSEQSLINAGTTSMQFYESNAEVNTETTTGNYIVTISSWTAMQNSLNTSFSTSAQQTTFNNNYITYGLDYLTNNPSATDGDAAAYALMMLFPGAINIYYAQPGSTTYAPLTINTSTEFDFITTLTCPNN
jgi:hypothetical protein